MFSILDSYGQAASLNMSSSLRHRRKNLETFREELESLIGPEQELDDIRDARPEVRSSLVRAERFLILSALVSVLLGGYCGSYGCPTFFGTTSR